MNKQQLFSLYISVNTFHPPTETVSDSTHIPPSVSSSCHRSSGPTKKTPGTVSHRVDAADRMWGYDGQWRNMCWHWELNPSYRWQVSVSVEAYDRWHLTPLNSRSADIPLVSMSRPIRIDCSTASLLHGQVTAVSSSSLVMMMLHIEPITAVCCAEGWLENHCLLYLIIQRSLIQHQISDSIGMNAMPETEFYSSDTEVRFRLLQSMSQNSQFYTKCKNIYNLCAIQIQRDFSHL